MTSRPSIWILEDDEALCSLLRFRFDAFGWCTISFHRPRSFEQELATGTRRNPF